MNYLYFPGCKVFYHLPQYDMATRAVLDALDVTLLECELNCCGYPVRHQNFEAAMFSAARILALAEKNGSDILTPCKCCYGNLKHAIYWMKRNPALRGHIKTMLADEGLVWSDTVDVKHLLSVLMEDVGVTTLKKHIVRSLPSVKVAVHYGCHAIRPCNIVSLDNPMAPTIFETLVDVTGATSVDWPLRLACCGAPLAGKNNALSLKLMERKLTDARNAGADMLCTACTYCQIQFDTVQAETHTGQTPKLPSILYPQLLGLALGIDKKRLGFAQNKLECALF